MTRQTRRKLCRGKLTAGAVCAPTPPLPPLLHHPSTHRRHLLLIITISSACSPSPRTPDRHKYAAGCALLILTADALRGMFWCDAHGRALLNYCLSFPKPHSAYHVISQIQIFHPNLRVQVELYCTLTKHQKAKGSESHLHTLFDLKM